MGSVPQRQRWRYPPPDHDFTDFTLHAFGISSAGLLARALAFATVRMAQSNLTVATRTTNMPYFLDFQDA
ncbi:hypothetical protein [Desulfovibrio sp. X2]|uniref:hypothetical protein n=1 Tax=Desulfovibrio sp. X2 TaxID=941449 RepID=UPI000552542E|nr:hypothetical protein [Desulfovibrio sp. X2]